MQYIAPFGNRLPTSEEELRALQLQMKRTGHIVGRAPNNISHTLSGGRQAPRSAYMALTSQEDHDQTPWVLIDVT